MKHFFTQVLDIPSLALGTITITLTLIASWLGALAALSTLVYNCIRMYDHYKNKKSKKDEQGIS